MSMLNGTDPSIGKSTVRQGLEDGIVVGVITLASALVVTFAGDLPSLPALYIAGLSALIAGAAAYARARQIQIPPKP